MKKQSKNEMGDVKEKEGTPIKRTIICFTYWFDLIEFI